MGESTRIARKAFVQVLAVGRRMRTIVGSHTREAKLEAALNIQFVQTSVHVTFIAADHPQDYFRQDSATGCEFVDDRIRLLE